MINHHYPILNVPVTTNQIMSIGMFFGGSKKPGESSSCTGFQSRLGRQYEYGGLPVLHKEVPPGSHGPDVE